MKKFLALALVAAMVLCSMVAFSACNGGKKQVKVFEAYELTAESYAFAVDKENTALKEAANELLADLKESGELSNIINSFFDGSATFVYENPVSSVPTGADRENYLVVATNASMAVERIGMPEAQIILAQAVSYVATAPKSNAACNAIFEALDKVKETGNLPVPTHLQDAHYKGSAKLGHGIGYKYAHDYKNHYVKQQYLPYELSGRDFYNPTGNGYEVKIREHMKRIRKEAEET